MGKINVEEVVIDGCAYVKKDSYQPAKKLDGLDYVIIRTYSAGVFAGYLKKRNGKEVHLLNARRIWQWYGASSLSQFAMEGTSRPSECKFPCEVNEIILTEAIEVIPCTEKAHLSINSVPVWQS